MSAINLLPWREAIRFKTEIECFTPCYLQLCF